MGLPEECQAADGRPVQRTSASMISLDFGRCANRMLVVQVRWFGGREAMFDLLFAMPVAQAGPQPGNRVITWGIFILAGLWALFLVYRGLKQ